ncbi:MAG: trigger factor [Candidatus Komeilibacteria bacterium]|jgi:trigger factor|nr:trigger factor [Candidatus Komeilibacteria bacterium]MBT4447491.1 trigger factor [Candidatus Komeilibacteria bacterium]
MKITKKDLEKNQVKLSIEVSLDEMKPHLEKAAEKMSKNSKLPGFRPGKAPYELVKNKFGEMAIYQEALDMIVNDSFYKAITREKVESVGQPEINIEKIAPGNPLSYTAIVALLPKVTLGEWQTLKVKKKKIEANDEDINKTLEQLQNMQVKESAVDRAAKKGDKIEVNFEVLIDKVVIEGGKNPKYPMVIGEGRMIPGFEDQIIGMKKDDKKEFELNFPKEYFKENLAGKLATFKVKLLSVANRELPKLDDELAKLMGMESMAKLKEQLSQNIKQDKEAKEKQRAEGEAIEAIVKQAKIEDIPEKLIDSEVHKMSHELEHSITQQGMDMAGYLKSINKTQEDLKKDFRPQAEERIKAALAMRQISQEEKIKIDDKEIDEEIKKETEKYKDNEEAMKNITHPNYRQHIANVITNQRIIDLIAQKVIK